MKVSKKIKGKHSFIFFIMYHSVILVDNIRISFILYIYSLYTLAVDDIIIHINLWMKLN